MARMQLHDNQVLESMATEDVASIVLKTSTILTAGSATFSTGEVTNKFGPRGVFIIRVTGTAGTTPSITFTINGIDPASGASYTVLASAAVTTDGTTILRVGPGFTAAANAAVNDMLPGKFSITGTLSGGGGQTMTVTVGAFISV